MGRILPYAAVLPHVEMLERTVFAPVIARNKRREDVEVSLALKALGGPVTADVVTVIPTYRRRELVARAVDSALAQDVPDHHVVVIDDFGGEVPDFADERVHVIRLSRNLGVAGVVRNVGIRSSRSRAVAFLDDDNYWDPKHLSGALPSLSKFDLTYTGIAIVNEAGEVRHEQIDEFDRDRMRRHNYIDTSAIVALRSPDLLFSRMKRRRGSWRIEDWELIYRLSRTHSVGVTRQVTVKYFDNPGSYFSVL